METTVLHGIDQSGASAQRPSQKAPDGFCYYDQTLRELLVRDNTLKNWFSASGRALYSASSPRMLADDFKAPTLDARYDKAVGSDAQCALAAIVAGKHNGEVALVAGDDAAGTMATNGSALAGPALVWEAEEGQITLEAKIKLSAITNVWFFFGLTDVLPSTTLEEPVSLAGTTYTTNATDAVGFMFDTAATTDTIRAVGVANDVDATHVNTGVEPVADTYQTFKLVLSAAGTASFYIDGVLVATVASAARVGVDLVPIVAVCSRSTATRTLTMDLWSAQ